MITNFDVSTLDDRTVRMFAEQREAFRAKVPIFSEALHGAMARELDRRANCLPPRDEAFEVPDLPDTELRLVVTQFHKLEEGFVQLAADLRNTEPTDPKSVQKYDIEQAVRFETTARFCGAIAEAAKCALAQFSNLS